MPVVPRFKLAIYLLCDMCSYYVAYQALSAIGSPCSRGVSSDAFVQQVLQGPYFLLGVAGCCPLRSTGPGRTWKNEHLPLPIQACRRGS